MHRLLLILAISLLCLTCKKEERQPASTSGKPQLIPAPQKILKRQGTVNLGREFYLLTDVSDSASAAPTNYLKKELQKLVGDFVEVADRFTNKKYRQTISLLLEEEHSPEEGYELTITSSQINIIAADAAGLYHGSQTLLQLLRQFKEEDHHFQLPKMVIKDAPQHSLRGILVRGDTISQALIDNMARLKMNLLVLEDRWQISRPLQQRAARRLIYTTLISTLPNNIWVVKNPDDLHQRKRQSMPSELKGTVVTIEPTDPGQLIMAAEIGWNARLQTPAKKDLQSVKLLLK